MKTLIVSAVLALASLAGCGAEQAQMPGPGEVTETAVHLNADGTEAVTTRIIKEGAASGVKSAEGLAQGISSDSGCAGADLWLYDGAALAGNRICFFGAGSVTLGSYRRTVCFQSGYSWSCAFFAWDHAVRSYYAGTSGGYFTQKQGDLFYDETFSPWKYVANAGTAARNSSFLTLTN